MTWLIHILLTISLTLTFFVGCNTRKQAEGSLGTGGAPSDTKTDGNKSAGTVDSGGGNTFMGKPLESYVIKVRDLPAFKDHVDAIIESEALKESDIKRVIYAILDKKTWYLIPAELKQLPADKVASAVGSDQAALQDFRQIWLNQTIFNDMESFQQATLIVHEIVMGLKLLKLDSALFECRARHFGRHSDQYCLNSYSADERGKPSDLTKIDYSQIRSVTKKIIDDGKKMSASDWNDLLFHEGFSSTQHEYVPKSGKKTLVLEQLGKMIENSKLIKSWPTLGYDFGKLIKDHPEMLSPGAQWPADFVWKSDSTCEFDIDVKGDVFSVTLKEGENKKTYSSRWTSVFDATLRQDTLEKNYFYHIDSPTLRQGEVAMTGEDVMFVKLKFSNEMLMGAEFDKTVCLDSDCSQSASSVNGYKMICSMKSSMRLSSAKK